MTTDDDTRVDRIRATCAALEDAWAAGDATAFAELHAEDATYVAFDGTVMLGRRAIAEGHRQLFDGIMRGSRLVTLDRLVRPVDDHVAIVVQRAGIVMRWQGGRTVPSRKRLSTSTSLVVRRDGRWSVQAFQNSRFRPWVSTPAGRVFARGAERPAATTVAPR